MKTKRLLMPAVTAIALTSMAFGATMVVPNGNTYFSGNSTAALPKGQSIEFQELAGSGQFHSDPITITAISFRAAAGRGAVDGTIGKLTVTLSTSPKFPNGSGARLMSSTFADNVGPDKTVVFSGSNVPLKDPGCAAPGPCPFNLTIAFQTPFVFSSSKGRLLIDMQENDFSASSGALDAVSFNAPGGSAATVSGAVGSATGTLTLGGPVVQITFTTTAPLITGVVNTASNIPPGMPNYGIAQGSLFSVYGSNMGPKDLAVAQLPFPTDGLSGTSIIIDDVNGDLTPVPIYFTRADVVVGVMPSSVPPGDAAVVLTYNGQVGNMPITVMQSNFGISNNLIPFTNNNVSVLNTAAVTFTNYQTITTTNTAKPGDTLVIWGTGLGATPNNGGDTGPPPAGNIGSKPQVFVGGVASPSVSYWGRAPGSIPGLDQINFQVPPDAPLGCRVSIVVQTSNGGTPVVSNAPTIALAAKDGDTCSDPTDLVPSSYLSANGAKVIYLEARQDTNVAPNPNGTITTTTNSRGQALLFRASGAQLAALARQANVAPSFGSCYVGINPNPDADGGFDFTLLDAGSKVTLTPPSGPALTLPSQDPGFYQSDRSSTAIPGGTWTFSNGAGGADVGPLTFKFPVPQPVTWTNQSALAGTAVDRTKPLTITWSGGDTNGYVDIQGSLEVPVALSGVFLIGFECAAPVSAGQLTIPPSILLAMPANPFASLQVGTVALPNIIGAVPGFDASATGSVFNTQILVNLK